MKKPSHRVTFLSRILAHLAIICLVFNPIALSAQTLPITPDGSTATQVTHTSSGIDQINIAAPNSSGLSHNTFTDYNVNAAGQVINNFSGKDSSEVVEGTGGVGVALTSSNIAGLVAVNPNLSSSGSARIILNEVTSSNDSQLLGYTEIAGTKAELIIANPNGITCSGCGFINTSRLSMIAGKSEFDQNNNLGFNLENQSPSTDLKIPLITISGLGLDVESTSATDIIASSIKLISTIYGSETTDITLKTGSGKYDTATKDLRLTTDDLPLAAQPLFALDATNLGAIQSGRIFIVATQDGFGVNLGKNLLATKSLNIDSAGNLYYENLTSPKINIKSTSNITQSGNIVTSGNLDITTTKTFTNFGILKSDTDINLTANSLENSFLINAKNLTINTENFLNKNGGIIGSFAIQNEDGTVSQFNTERGEFVGKNFSNFGNVKAGDLAFNISHLTNSGIIRSINDLQLTTVDLNNSGEISSQTNLNIEAAGDIENSNKIFSNEALNISATKLTNSGDAAIASLAGSLVFHLKTNLENNGELYSKKNLVIEVDELSNFGNIFSAENLTSNVYQLTNYGILQSVGDLQLTTSDLENSGSIKSFKTSTINADSLVNQIDALIFSADNLTISASNLLTNSGSIFSNAKLDLTSGLATNNSEIFSVGDLKFTLTKDLNNTGSVNSLANLDVISSSSITNSNQILSSGNLTLSAGNLTNSNNIQSGGNLTLNLATLSNLKNIISGGDFNVTASGNISNSSTLQSANNFTINAANLTNSTSSLISSEKDLTIKAASIINKNTKPSNGIITSGLVAQNGNITLRTNFLNNDSGIIVAKNTDLNSLANDYSAVLSNILGKFFSTKSISLNLGNIDYTITGELSAQDIDITANNITNLGNVTANDFIKLNAIGSAAISNGNVTNGVAGGNNSNVKLSAGSYLTAIANRFISNYGTISANTDLTLTSNYSEIKNYGTITGGNGITTLNALNSTAGEFNNYFGAKLTANNNLIINAKNLNNFGEISVRNDLVVTVPQNLYNNPTALIWSGRDATFNVANNFVNTQAEIYAERNLTIRGSDLTAAIQNKTYLDQNMTYLFQNFSGNIETYSGDILIKAMNFYNGRKDGNPVLEVTWNEAYRVCDSNVSWCQHGEYRLPLGVVLGNHNLFNWISLGSSYSNYAYAARRKENNDLKTIYSGKDLTIQSDAFTNEVANIFSAKNMNITSQRFFGNLSKTYGGMFFSDSYNSEHCGGSWGCFKYWKNYYDNPYFFTTYNALIKSGSSLTGTVSSQINNTTISQNTAVSGIAAKSKSTNFDQIDKVTIIETGIINLDLSRIISAINNNSSQKSIQPQAIEFKVPSLITNPEQSPSDTIQQLPLQKISSEQISANNLSNSQIFDKINLGSLTINTTATLSANPLTPLIEARSKFTNIENYYGSDYLFIKLGLTKEQFFQQLEEEANKIRLEAEALRNAETKSSNQSTNESLINQLSQQIKQTQLIRFLGDSFTESKLLKEQLSSLRKDAMMLNEDGEGGEEEIKSLLDNTATELKKLNLTLAEVATKGLTQSQINSLEKDIITFEATNLNGMNIIVPKIYLSLKTREELMGGSSSLVHSAEDLMSSSSLLTSSTIFAKGDFTLNSPTASLLNSGSIISGKNMTLNLASLKNKTTDSKPAEIISKNNLTITAVSDIKNLGAKILTTNDLRLTTLNGSILNSSLIQTNDANLLTPQQVRGDNYSDSYQLRFGDSARTSSNISSNLISTASLTAKNISINAGNDFTNLAAKISSSEDLKIAAANNITIATLQLHNRTEEHWGNKKSGGDRIIDTTTNLQSEISSAGNIEIISGNDTTLQAAKLTAQENIDIIAGNNLLLTTAQNSSFKMESIRKNKTFTFKNNDNGYVNSEVLNNEITVGEAVGDRRQAVGEGDGSAFAQATDGQADSSINLTAQNTAYIEYKSGTNPLAPNGYSATSSQLQNLKAETILTNPIEEIHKSWNKSNSGLNQTGMITIAIVGAVATGGLGSFATVGAAIGSSMAGAAGTIAATSAANSAIDGRNLSQVTKQTLKDTTSKQSLQQIAIAGAAAGLAVGAINASGLNQAAVATASTGGGVGSGTVNTVSTTSRIATNLTIAMQKAAIYSTSNIIATSAIKGQSLNQTIEEQGGGEKILINTALNALAETGAKEIGNLAHGFKTDSAGNILTNASGEQLHQIDKATQLTLHATLGAGISALRGNDNVVGILSGAAAAAVGELAADSAYSSGSNANKSIAIGQVAGSLAALTTSIAAGASDEQTAKNIQLGNYLAGNAASNNATYVSKKTGNVIAEDGENDNKVILVDDAEESKIFNNYIKNLLVTNSTPDATETLTGAIKISPLYQNETNGTFYNLTNKSDFDIIKKLTGLAGLNYSGETMDKIFNSKLSTLTTDDMTRIFFQNGMENDYNSAAKSAALIEQATGQKVGLIVNSTDPHTKIEGDIKEFLPTQLTLKDVLNAEVFQQIANNTPQGQKNTIIMHSAGNEDAIKAAQLLAMKNVNLNGKIDFVSVGSPRSLTDLKAALEPIGGNVVGQYNNWKDPVTHYKLWVGGITATAAATAITVGTYAARKVGIDVMSTMTPEGTNGFALMFDKLAAYSAGGAAGGAAGFGGAKIAKQIIKIQHPFEAYFEKDFKGLKTDIQSWSAANPD